jgi:hypothetical protein
MTTMEKELERVAEPARGGWQAIGRLLMKAAVLFAALNLLFALLFPISFLGPLSLYNRLLPGRQRLPYGENPAQSYNLTLSDVPAMFASHELSRAKPDDEFRVVIVGDSGTWGWLLENEETLAGQINQAGYTTPDGRRIVAYNLAYPVLSVTKDLLLLEQGMAYEPDLIVWPVTLDSLPYAKQLTHPLLQDNPEPVRELIRRFGLALDENDESFRELSFWERTIVGQRRALADLLRLQAFGFSWAATGIDQHIPAEFPLRQSDFEEDESWQGFAGPTELTADGLAFDVLAAGFDIAGEVPILLVNEPIFISSGENSDLRYNSFYPRWAFDQYRTLLSEQAAASGWRYLDLWNAVSPEEFTDTPVHLTPDGTAQYAELVGWELMEMVEEDE